MAAITVKLIVDTSTKKVLFAEAQKDFVDFLKSLQSLGDVYLESGFDKDLLGCPRVGIPIPAMSSLLKYGEDDSRNTEPAVKKYYYCSASKTDCDHQLFSFTKGVECSCVSLMTVEKKILLELAKKGSGGGASAVKGGYIKGVVTYMVTDDLVVTPMSYISGIMLLKRLNVKDADVVEEKVVEIGMEEGLKMLDYSLRSSTVLTDVLLLKK